MSNREGRELTEKVIFKHRCCSEGLHESIPGYRKSTCKGPGAGLCSLYFRNSMGCCVTGVKEGMSSEWCEQSLRGNLCLHITLGSVTILPRYLLGTNCVPGPGHHGLLILTSPPAIQTQYLLPSGPSLLAPFHASSSTNSASTCKCPPNVRPVLSTLRR